MLYETLDEALKDVAERSFYESCLVRKVDGGYDVSDHHTGVEETAPWTYEKGTNLSRYGNVLDYSRTHEPYEFYDEAHHVRYNLPAAVEAIESGQSVGFTYVIAEAHCEDLSLGELEPCYEDHSVGWLLVATDES